MKLKLPIAVVLAGLTAFLALAEEPKSAAESPEPPDEGKVSYALGMNLGLQIKRIGADVDVNVIARAMKDVMEGKPTQIQESEMRPLFMQAQAYEMARKSGKNKADGEAFLSKNAKAPGITVLPDGLQYRVITEGAGEIPKSTNVVTFSFRGTWTDGTEFLHKEHVQMPLDICPKGIREALQLMKAGSKWQIFVPSDLSYTHQPKQAYGYGSTLIYELELFPEGAVSGEHYGGGRLGHPPGDEFLPADPGTSKQGARAAPSVVLPAGTVK